MELNIFNSKGEKTTKKAKLNDEVFSIEPNDHAIYLDVKQIQANGRQGTHKVKERGEHSGSTKKLKRQKGTGGARSGSIKNPTYGNGRTFGPRPRDYSFKLNKKLKKLARKSAFSYKVKDNQITVVESFSFENPKTKQCIELLKNFKLDDKKTLLVLGGSEANIVLSARNLQNFKVVQAVEVNTIDILDAEHILIAEKSIALIETSLSN
ncbi:MAG TPA: 50S ribosomal protein L4 [Bacteroidia bacterium]|jgi:large subunit ribosomal protein L4|nr:50S ribosomal protein L4 [Bacteroidia bacterium]